MNRQRGFLAIAAVAMIVLVGILSTAIVALAVRASLFSIHLGAKNKAVFIAESGLEQGRSNLTQDILANRQTCIGLSSTVSMTGGRFTVVPASDAANLLNPRYAFSTLSTPISSGATPATIEVSDTSVFAPYGRVLIGREVFQYDRIATSTTLDGITRAQDVSLNQGHASGTLVSQYQCTIQSTGNSPATHPEGVRQYRQGIQQPAVFAVGASGTILRWNGASELQWDNQSPGTYNFNDLSILNYHSGWAVAEGTSNDFRLSRLQGNTWSNFAVSAPSSGGGPTPSNELYSVYATSPNEAWAVGTEGKQNAITILYWTRNALNSNTNWCLLNCGGKTINDTGVANNARDFYGVKAVDTNGDGAADIGFAVGGQPGQTGSGANRAVILVYNGTTWSLLASPALPSSAIGQLYGVDIIENGNNAPLDAYFVGLSSLNGEGGKILRLRGGTWTVITTTQQMNSISGVDVDGDGLADFIVAVGNGGLVHFMNANMSITNTFTLSGAPDLTGVVALSPSDVWAVGNGGVRWHYNGSSWVLNASGGANLQGVQAIYPKQNPASSWHDVIN
ncbi:hypothetical protein [Legionella yabuuchiae]|uniref:hypothetical protein n=1 Tax=Legionella yabuuchiae TaxID=376727 RepID=UPI0010541694|nr:hypothetical protein [Legionella yabuuchiae]